jgi:hypothetical protein
MNKEESSSKTQLLGQARNDMFLSLTSRNDVMGDCLCQLGLS